VTLTLGQIFQPFLWLALVGAFPDERGFGVVPLVGLAAFVGSGVVSVRLESRVREHPVSMLDWARAWAVQWLFYFAPYVVLFVLIPWQSDKFNWTVLWLALAYLGLLLILSLGGTLVLARWTGLLRPAPERLQTIVDRAVQRMGVQRPVAYVLRWKAANALAFPFSRAMAVTDVALHSCTDEELLAIWLCRVLWVQRRRLCGAGPGTSAPSGRRYPRPLLSFPGRFALFLSLRLTASHYCLG